MKKLQYSVTIAADPKTVYDIMLGKETFKLWTAAFNPTSDFEGSWEKGQKISFVGTNKDGQKEGMVGVIRENIPEKFVSIEYVAVLEAGKELTEGAHIESWLNTFENYTFEKVNGATKVTVDIDMGEEMVDFFDKTYPKALQILKDLCES